MVKENYSEVAATKLTPSQLAFVMFAKNFAVILDDNDFRFVSEREGSGTDSAFFREAILFYSRAIMERVARKTKQEGFDLLEWVNAQLLTDSDHGSGRE